MSETQNPPAAAGGAAPYPPFIGAAARMGPGDVAEAAAAARVPVPNLRAVLKVETAGSGFDDRGRPVILFEPHVFYRNLPAGPLRDRAVAAGIAAERWGVVPYARGQDANYERLAAAWGIDRDAALKSCSWGIGQILGENYRVACFPTVGDFVAAAMESERNQLLQMTAFIRRAGLINALAEGRWAVFARGYNGPGYAKNHYDAKLEQYAAAFAAEAAQS